MPAGPPARSRRGRPGHDLGSVLAVAVELFNERGDIRPDTDAMITARLLFGLVNSIVEWYRPARSADAASLADPVCAMAFDGLRTRRR